jgi:hypothetical protein
MLLLQVALSVKVTTKGPSTVAFAAAVSAGAGGDGILNADEVIDVRPVDVKVMVAPVTAVEAAAVRFVKVATPLTPAFVVVPPIVHEPAPTVANTLAVLVVALPYWSVILTTGCVPSTAPLLAGAAGCVPIASLLAAPAPITCVTEAALYPVALTTIALEPALCSRVEADGVKVICPAETL